MFNVFGETEKRSVFNRTFWLGVVSGTGVFVLLNIASYLIEDARSRGYLEKRGISLSSFSGFRGFEFGFPWHWHGDANGLSNLLVCMLFGFAFGLSARYFFRLPKIGLMK